MTNSNHAIYYRNILRRNLTLAEIDLAECKHAMERAQARADEAKIEYEHQARSVERLREELNRNGGR